MKSTEFINEATSGTNDYQQMMTFVNANKAPGVPAEQQVALAMYKELQKQQALSKNLQAELQAAEQRIDQATQSGEMSSRELGKHQAELERERERGTKQKAALGRIDQEHSDRERASAEQLQQLTSQLEQVKRKPGVSAEAGKALEKQIEELKTNGVDSDKYDQLVQSVSKMQNMQQVDDKTLKGLMSQVNDAQAKAAEFGKVRDELGQQIEKTTGDAEEQLTQLKQQLAQLNGMTNALNAAVTDVLPGKIEQVTSKVAELDGENEMVYDELEKHDALLNKLAGGQQTPPQTPPQQTPPQAAPAPQQRKVMAANPGQIAPRLVQSPQWAQPEPTFEDTQLLKSIKWATGK